VIQPKSSGDMVGPGKIGSSAIAMYISPTFSTAASTPICGPTITCRADAPMDGSMDLLKKSSFTLPIIFDCSLLLGFIKKQALPQGVPKKHFLVSLRWHYPDQVQRVGIYLSAFRHPYRMLLNCQQNYTIAGSKSKQQYPIHCSQENGGMFFEERLK
jgi:hypothetical protein